MCEEEALAAKLDEDIDNFMEDLVAKRQNKPIAEKKEWSYEEWEKDIDNHPAFCKRLPENGELPESIQALQALKFSEDESAEERALAFKNEGNKFFKKGHYKWAVKAYTDGLKCKPDASHLSVLYANRAAAHSRLSNFGSAFKDCTFALRHDPTHAKAFIRATQCLLSLRKPKEALDWLNSSDLDILDKRAELTNAANSLLKIVERDNRKKKRLEDGRENDKHKLVEALKDRKIRCDPPLDHLLSADRDLSENVRLDEDNVLHWNVMVRYPGPDIQDIVHDFNETCTIRHLLSILLEEPPDFDPGQLLYNVDTVLVQYKDYNGLHLSEQDNIHFKNADIDARLCDILCKPECALCNMYPLFYIIPK